MHLRAIGVSLILLPVAWGAERVEHRDFDVRPVGPSFRLETYRGEITVTAGAVGRMHVEVHEVIEGAGAAGAGNPAYKTDPGYSAEAFRRLDVQWHSAPEGVAIAARNPTQTGARFLWDEKYRLALRWVVTVPSDTRVELTTRDGAITVGDLAGSVTARGRRAAVYLKHIRGDVEMSNEEGLLVLSAGGGRVHAVTRLGDIQLGGVAGPLDAQSVSGDIDVERVGGSARLRTDSGNISFEVGRPVPAGIDVAASGGSIHVRVIPSAAFTLHAKSVWGHVHSRVPLQVTHGGNGARTLEGRCNGGGPLVSLYADGGQIDLRPAPL